MGRVAADRTGVQQYKVIDAALGVIERGTWKVADAVAEQPWLPNGPIPLEVTWTRAASSTRVGGAGTVEADRMSTARRRRQPARTGSPPRSPSPGRASR